MCNDVTLITIHVDIFCFFIYRSNLKPLQCHIVQIHADSLLPPWLQLHCAR